MNETLKAYADPEESNDNNLVDWLGEIQDAIEDGEEVSEENLEAWKSRPECWESRSFESGVIIENDPRGKEVWANITSDTAAIAASDRKEIARSKEIRAADEKYDRENPNRNAFRGTAFK